jgi:hypothetical protein
MAIFILERQHVPMFLKKVQHKLQKDRIWRTSGTCCTSVRVARTDMYIGLLSLLPNCAKLQPVRPRPVGALTSDRTKGPGLREPHEFICRSQISGRKWKKLVAR